MGQFKRILHDYLVVYILFFVLSTLRRGRNGKLFQYTYIVHNALDFPILKDFKFLIHVKSERALQIVGITFSERIEKLDL